MPHRMQSSVGKQDDCRKKTKKKNIQKKIKTEQNKTKQNLDEDIAGCCRLYSPSLIRRILKSLANISSSRICGESIGGASSCSRIPFRCASPFTSPPGPPETSSAERSVDGSEEKPWLKAQELLLSP